MDFKSVPNLQWIFKKTAMGFQKQLWVFKNSDGLSKTNKSPQSSRSQTSGPSLAAAEASGRDVVWLRSVSLAGPQPSNLHFGMGRKSWRPVQDQRHESLLCCLRAASVQDREGPGVLARFLHEVQELGRVESCPTQQAAAATGAQTGRRDAYGCDIHGACIVHQ